MDNREHCLRYLMGEATEQEVAALDAWIAESPANAEQFALLAAQESSMSAAVGNACAPEAPEAQADWLDQALALRRRHEIEDEANRQLAAQQAEEARNRRFELRRQAAQQRQANVVVLSKPLVWLGFAAVIGFLVAVAYLATPQKPEPDATGIADRAPVTTPNTVETPAPVTVARVVDSVDARWQGHTNPDQIEAGSALTLEAGFAEVRLAGQGAVLLEGPATIEVVDEQTLRYVSGRIVTQAHQSADPFTLLMDNTALTCGGGEFGVNRLSRGTVNTVVYSGTLDIAHAAHPGRTSVAVVEAGQAATLATRRVRVEAQSQATQDDMVEFHRTLAGTRLRPQSASSSVQFLSTPPASLHFGSLEDSRQVRLIPEAQSIYIDSDTVISLGGTIEPTLGSFPLSQGVDSYLIHMDPAGGEEERAVVLTGSITFDRPIQAVLGDPRDLARTDRLFGSPSIAYPRSSRTAGGPDGDLTWGIELADDSVSISPDRRTLNFRLQAGSSLDQLRILVLSADRNEAQ